MPYKNRSTGLVIFGLLTILLGCLSGLLVPLILFGQAMSAKTTDTPLPFSTILPGILMYGILAVALVWLGIGSILARRWARALLLIFSWSWLILGVFVLVFMAFLLPKMLTNISAGGTPGHPGLPPAAMVTMMVFMFLIFGVLFVLLPGVWTFFYNSQHVKATCEARDPVRRWTDTCPLPVLAFCLWSLFSALTLLVMPFMAHGVTPFFGMFLTGLPGTLFYLAQAVIWSLAAWLLYKLDQRGWWLILIFLGVFMASALLTYARHDILEMYRLMGYPEAQIAQIQKTGLLTGNRMNWITLFSMLPLLGYLLYVKKFLRRSS